MEHPVFDHKSSIRADGSREKIRIADVAGRFTNAKSWVYPLWMGLFFIIPFIKWKGSPAIFIDIVRRQFFLLGYSFNAQDVYLIFFVLTGAAFSLFFITAIWGRVWCGWGCPQTFLLEGFYRKIERWIEGSRGAQLRSANAPWGGGKLMRFITKHAIFLVFSVLIAMGLLHYFNPISSFVDLWTNGLSSHPTMTFWLIFLSCILYINFSWFREQLCLIVCPYGRLQSTLTDDDSLVIGYDEIRGEPRGKLDEENRGDCIDCHRCVVVCPTGIDIRNGLQLECIGCANCIDACDDIMDKTGQAKGLIRYDSLNGLKGDKRQILRPRVYLYMVLLIIGVGMLSLFVSKRTLVEANVLRLQGAPYILTEEWIRNQYEIHLFNKTNAVMNLEIIVRVPDDSKITLPVRRVQMNAMSDQRVPLFVEVPRRHFKKEFDFEIIIVGQDKKEIVKREVKFLGGIGANAD